jgi:hypothetical protein
MTGLGWRLAALLSGAAIPIAAGGIADAASNNVYLGQTGITNTITITQAGLDNQVGADTTNLLLNQEGRDNIVTVSQTGWWNAVATVAHVLPLDAIYLIPAVGIDQVGDANVMSLIQSNLEAIGYNTIEAVRQAAADGFTTTSNTLSVTQSPNGGDGGAAQHYIGEIVQINPDVGSAANSMVITQTGGGAGVGNFIESVRHEGHGNSIVIEQSSTSNNVSFVRQLGNGNSGTLIQQDGDGNTIWASEQYGVGNQMAVTESGNHNYVWSAVQNNATVAVKGNIMTISLSGDDNGGDGHGGFGRFSTVAGDIGVIQARVAQLGDDNSISYTVGRDATGPSTHNLFGFYQDGTGNQLAGTATGSDNEAATRQVGDGNYVAFTQSGAGNAVAASMDGDSNYAAFDQSGTGNIAHLTMGGTLGSNNNNAPSLAFSATLAGAGLSPGEYRQSGAGNDLELTILNGSSNASATSQTGDHNLITGAVSGTYNQAVVVQDGHGNIAGFSQNGSNNYLIIQQ